MTLLEDRSTKGAAGSAKAPGKGSGWIHDLGLGIRFAVGGGREGWIRTLLTAVGVGLGIALLLVASSVPNLLDNRSERTAGRAPNFTNHDAPLAPGDNTLVYDDASSEYRGDTVGGWLLRPDGAHPPIPPGLDRIPAPGDMVVSPALKDLLESPEGRLLKERLTFRMAGTIADEGLSDPHDLYMYAGSDTITQEGGGRTAQFGANRLPEEPMDPVLVILVILICVVLLVPVAIFIATAVRFGGERRDRRLAALRLIGADIRMTRRAAAGESLFGTGVGLLFGAVFFLVGRQLVGVVQFWRVSAFPSDLVPMPGLAVLIVLSVPVCAVLVTLFALRSVAIEPLGVVRQGRFRKRRLMWRLPMPVIGVALLLFSDIAGGEGMPLDTAVVAAGIILILLGMATLLPWLVESVVARLRGGPVPWQLAIRRLQLSSTAATRAVSGITVAVAGAIALQMYFVGINDDFNTTTGQDPKRAQMGVTTESANGALAERMIKEFRATEGVKGVIGTIDSYVLGPGVLDEWGDPEGAPVTYGTCATLRELAHLGACKDGDVFISHTEENKDTGWVKKVARPGKQVDLNEWYQDEGSEKPEPQLWTIPKDARTVTPRKDPGGEERHGIFVTPGALDAAKLPSPSTTAQIQTDESVPDAQEHVRNTAYLMDPSLRIWTYQMTQRDKQYDSIRTGLFVGATATMILIAASMLVSQIEQLRERKKLLSVLVAFGTRRSTLAWSILWQTAIPVVLGTALAVVGGLGLGRVMLRLIDKEITDWLIFLPLVGVGAVMIAAVTLLSLPPLWRMMRPDGLRTE
ncbi:ABC transporter permease [Streptomyces sp. NBC_00234]|uniref:FtsX-like permease family protein n=1 Tax=Streptomyces sp. NBC_00234 TaxID=2903638 RepID=UPI002E28AD3A|nr:FtsX-like permease family protein [Streptomyces sp. NBC_00234]